MHIFGFDDNGCPLSVARSLALYLNPNFRQTENEDGSEDVQYLHKHNSYVGEQRKWNIYRLHWH